MDSLSLHKTPIGEEILLNIPPLQEEQVVQMEMLDLHQKF
jgi:hypothetical protein